MKKIWIPLAVALLLLTGCIPKPDATPLPTQQPGTAAATDMAASPSAQATAQTSATTLKPSDVPASSGQPAYWPSEVPANVPAFEYGSYVQTAKNGGEVTIVCSGVSKEDYADYRERLISAGFFLASEEIDPVGVSAFLMNGPGCVISLRVTKDDYAEWKYTPAG